MQLAATAMRAGVRLEQLADLEFAYPTFTAVVELLARRIAPSNETCSLVSQEHDGSERLSLAEWELRSG